MTSRHLAKVCGQVACIGVAILAAPAAWAAGGAHVVDDAGVESPGACHLETWVTRYGAGRGLLNVFPACTHRAWPRLEIGGGLQHIWAGRADTIAGPAFKLNLRPVETGLGVGVTTAAAWSVRSGRLETASVIVPVTVAIGERAVLNLNAGWTHAQAAARENEAFLGGQVDFQLGRNVSIMAEAFGRNHGKSGVQMGLRWTPAGGPIDLDLLAGRRVDGASPNAITIGLTVRH